MCHCAIFVLLSRSAKIVWQTMLFWGIGLLCFVAMPVYAQPATPHLVKDINQSTGNSKPEHFTSVGSTLYFVADDGLHGRELWKTDGSANGTVLVKDIAPGVADSEPDALFDFNGMLFFNAKDINGDTELWRSDGTVSGTERVKDINPTSSSAPHEFVILNQHLYFIADDGLHGALLWRSDGTEANTTLVKDLYPNNPSVLISSLVVVNGSILLIVYDPVGGVYGFWRSDGTANGTTWLTDINLADVQDLFLEHTVLNNTLYFATKDNLGKIYLWKSDGTAVGTVIVRQITPPSGIYDQVYSFTVMDNVLYFMAREGANCGLWRSNGAAAGTILVTSACINSLLVSVNHTLYFTGMDANTGIELWRSDGTPTGSAPVKDIVLGADSSYPSIGGNVGGVLYFFAEDETQHGLWRSDGTAAGTTLVKKLDWGGVSLSIHNSVPFAFYNWNGIAYFSAEDGQRLDSNDSQAGYEPWKSDGTAAGTTLVKDINTLTNSSYPERLTMVGNTLYFLARDPINAQELWKSTGTTASTTLLSDINPNGIGARIREVVGGAQLVYLRVNNDSDSEIWRSDGTVAGTIRLKTVTDSDTTQILAMTTAGDTLYFVISETGVGWTLWKSDGTPAGTVPVTLLTTTGVSTPKFLLAHNGVVYFTLSQNNGNQLQYQWWRSDGTAAGTMLLKDFSPGWMMAAGNTFYFAAFSNGQTSLWKSDGTAAGSVLVKADVADFTSEQPVVMNGILYFRGYDSVHGWELWKSDGTDAGTTLVKDINPGSDGSDPAYYSLFVEDNGTLYFVAEDKNGYGLWKSDGSEVGTVLVKSFPATGPFYQFTVVNHHLYLLNELNNGNKELWISDGTETGTKTLKNLNDSVSDLPYDYVVTLVGSSNNIYFVANDPNTGFELWTLAELDSVEAPVATNDVFTVTITGAITLDVLENDTDGNQDRLALTRVTQPAHGTATIANNQIVYTPTSNFSGTDSFTYTISDGNGGEATGTVTVIVHAISTSRSLFLPLVRR